MDKGQKVERDEDIGLKNYTKKLIKPWQFFKTTQPATSCTYLKNLNSCLSRDGQPMPQLSMLRIELQAALSSSHLCSPPFSEHDEHLKHTLDGRLNDDGSLPLFSPISQQYFWQTV